MPILMILVSVAIMVLPIALSPDERVVLGIAFDVTLLGVPLFFISSWDRATETKSIQCHKY